MSGGFFDYQNHRINDVMEQLADVIERRGIPSDFDATDTYPLECSEETYSELRNGLAILRAASIYAHRIDWFLSGDDGEDCFLRRLKEELAEMNAVSLFTHTEWMVDGEDQYVDVCLNKLTEEEFDTASDAARTSHVLIVANFVNSEDVE